MRALLKKAVAAAAGALAIALFVLSPAVVAAQDAVTPQNKAAIEKVVRDYILNNPEIVVEAIEALRERRRLAEANADQEFLRANAEQIYNDTASATDGNLKGDVTIVEFFDYRCGVCKRVHPIVKELMKGDPNIRRVMKEWPILGPNSVVASRAAIASRKQGDKLYFAFHNAMMEAKANLEMGTVMRIAKSVGLDTDQLSTDMKDPAINGIIQRNYALAENLKLNGTPSFLIGDRIIRGGQDLESMRQLVAIARQKK